MGSWFGYLHLCWIAPPFFGSIQSQITIRKQFRFSFIHLLPIFLLFDLIWAFYFRLNFSEEQKESWHILRGCVCNRVMCFKIFYLLLKIVKFFSNQMKDNEIYFQIIAERQNGGKMDEWFLQCYWNKANTGRIVVCNRKYHQHKQQSWVHQLKLDRQTYLNFSKIETGLENLQMRAVVGKGRGNFWYWWHIIRWAQQKQG